ncbi:hypothetical protein [Nocardia sp. NPDC057030]|uniref:hypothetical protein n=1 Tax=unclassified Nocardia TaxID=2637762 RepID=UPI003628F0C1
MTHHQTDRLEVGTRVRHYTHQFPRAYTEGTATIVHVIKQHAIDDTWEYKVRLDNGELAEWNYVYPVPEKD